MGRGGQWYPASLHGVGCASAESCTMSRSLSHGQPSQAREQDVHKHGGVGQQGVLRNYTYLVLLLLLLSQEAGSG